jgi:hypothetical protein
VARHTLLSSLWMTVQYETCNVGAFEAEAEDAANGIGTYNRESEGNAHDEMKRMHLSLPVTASSSPSQALLSDASALKDLSSEAVTPQIQLTDVNTIAGHGQCMQGPKPQATNPRRHWKKNGQILVVCPVGTTL